MEEKPLLRAYVSLSISRLCVSVCFVNMPFPEKKEEEGLSTTATYIKILISRHFHDSNFGDLCQKAVHSKSGRSNDQIRRLHHANDDIEQIVLFTFTTEI